MSTQERRNCPRCRALVPVGETWCENGHDCSWPASTTSLLEGLGDLMDDSASLLSDENPPRDAVFECRHCNRLVEAQSFQDKTVYSHVC